MRTMLLATPAERRAAADLADLLDGGGRPRDDLAPLLDVAVRLRAAAPEAQPSADFRTALRARLVAEAAARPATPVPAPRSTAPADTRPPRLRQAAATVAAVALVGGAGAAVASSSALPGDALYGLKRGLESAQLSIAGSDLARGREHLEQADARLGEAERLAADSPVRSDDRARIASALDEMDTDVRAGSQLLTEVYRTTGDAAALELLDRFVVDQHQRLEDLLGRLADLDPALAEQARETASLLARLHAEVQTLTATALTRADSAAPARDARADRQSDDGWVVSRMGQELARGGGSAKPSAGSTDATAATDQQGGLADGLTSAAVDADGLLRELPGAVGVTPGPATDQATTPDVPEPQATVATLPGVPSADDDLPEDDVLDDVLDDGPVDIDPTCGPLGTVLDC